MFFRVVKTCNNFTSRASYDCEPYNNAKVGAALL